MLGAATGVSWGFVAAVIKELSAHLGDGIVAIVTNWSLYVLIGAGAATLLLASHALAARPAGRVAARVHHPGPAVGQPARVVPVR